MPPRIDFTAQRLFIDQPMQQGASLALDKMQSNYLVNVLRMREGQGLLVFNGRDGEWRAALAKADKKTAVLSVENLSREQTPASDIWLCFAPIKSSRLDFLIEKAVEMGASKLVPIITNRTQVQRLNHDRMRANVIEAAEQCGLLSVPEIAPETKLAKLDALIDDSRTVIFCDEFAPVANPVIAMQALPKGAPVAIVIGPEGGFDESERQMLNARKHSIAIALGPRILRADTAVIASLAAVQLAIGDWA
ncbi:MAG: 16S rRNA (uracil(1498)-N(3))-methyltransferase [Beijerinckiaceae bacterium]